ncbi:MAG: hypothetical protein U0228_34670 [Myxococcaceae bacterium]
MAAKPPARPSKGASTSATGFDTPKKKPMSVSGRYKPMDLKVVSTSQLQQAAELKKAVAANRASVATRGKVKTARVAARPKVDARVKGVVELIRRFQLRPDLVDVVGAELEPLDAATRATVWAYLPREVRARLEAMIVPRAKKPAWFSALPRAE